MMFSWCITRIRHISRSVLFASVIESKHPRTRLMATLAPSSLSVASYTVPYEPFPTFRRLMYRDPIITG
jgi:hypothetical protein